MFLTSTECRAMAEEKPAEADRDERHRKRLAHREEDHRTRTPGERDPARLRQAAVQALIAPEYSETPPT